MGPLFFDKDMNWMEYLFQWWKTLYIIHDKLSAHFRIIQSHQEPPHYFIPEFKDAPCIFYQELLNDLQH